MDDINFSLQSQQRSKLQKKIVSLQIDIAKYLTDKFENPLLIAIEEGHFQIVQYLLKNVNVNVNSLITTRSNERKTPLLIAAECGKTDIIMYLIRSGALVNNYPPNVQSPLYTAVSHGYFRIVRYLIRKGADTDQVYYNSQDPEQLSYTCLYIAANHGFVKIVKLLLSRGVKVDERYGTVRSPLFIASKNGHYSVVRCLISYGANINIVYDGVFLRTALNAAISNGFYKVVKLLIQEGADQYCAASVPNRSWPISPVFLAARHDQLCILKYLLENQCNNVNQQQYTDISITTFHVAVFSRSLHVVQYLISQGADVNCINQYSSHWHEFPLLTAVGSGCNQMVRLLLVNGANVNQVDKDRQSSLHLACKHNQYETVKILIEFKADLNLTDRLGFTALDLARNFDIL
jgi:ankyrin repeat protein